MTTTATRIRAGSSYLALSRVTSCSFARDEGRGALAAQRIPFPSSFSTQLVIGRSRDVAFAPRSRRKARRRYFDIFQISLDDCTKIVPSGATAIVHSLKR